ncbi:MAG: hypothetical protein AB1452_09100 [Pseudomonadota bacterium]
MKQGRRVPDPTLESLYARLDQVRMADFDRLQAKASLARAEAVAKALQDLATGSKRLLRTLVVRPIRRLTSALG